MLRALPAKAALAHTLQLSIGALVLPLYPRLVESSAGTVHTTLLQRVTPPHRNAWRWPHCWPSIWKAQGRYYRLDVTGATLLPAQMVGD